MNGLLRPLMSWVEEASGEARNKIEANLHPPPPKKKKELLFFFLLGEMSLVLICSFVRLDSWLI